MDQKRAQSGMGMTEIMLMLFIIGFVATLVLKIWPYYMDDRTVASTIREVHKDIAAKDIYEVSNSDIKARFGKSFQVNSVSDEVMQSLEITRDGGRVIVTFDYEIRVGFMGNIDLLLKFYHEADFSEPPEAD